MSMLELLWLVPTFPLLGFLLLVFFNRRHNEWSAGIIGAGSIGAAAIVTLLVGIEFMQLPADKRVYEQTLWTWMSVGGFSSSVTLYLDALSLTMLGVITGVGFFIHLFATGYMHGDDGFPRFFSYMNLFVCAMLMLVLGDNLLVLYLGWEGVGLCSYLLIGFWYKDPANGAAARKAFIVTRVGDVSMAIGLFMLFWHLGTLEIQPLMQRALEEWGPGGVIPVTIAFLLLGGAVGKSAQLPLQTWLPDAMAGPTPVSALIHAATMVTAGVYLIARTHTVFELAPTAQYAVGLVGAATLLIAGFTALVQRDIKRVLAYSTMSQIGYMFLALGVGAWSAGIFHLMTHAFFKALLFLAAGAVILAVHHEQDIFKMGGLRKKVPLAFWSIVIGSAALAALPFTSGFASKDEILWQAWLSGHRELYVAGLFGAFLTAFYITRMIVIAFFGEPRDPHAADAHPVPGPHLALPLIVLMVMSLAGGYIHLPLEGVLPPSRVGDTHVQHQLEFLSVGISLFGIALAWLVFHTKPGIAPAAARNPVGALLHRYWSAAWGFDYVYDLVFVRPFVWLAHLNHRDVVDRGYDAMASVSKLFHGGLSRSQTGNLRWYAAAIAIGGVLVVGIAVWVPK